MTAVYNDKVIWFDDIPVTELVDTFEANQIMSFYKVKRLIKCIKKYGYFGVPILGYKSNRVNQLITGSYRLQALKFIVAELREDGKTDKEIDLMYPDVAVDITKEVDAACVLQNCVLDELPLDNLSSWMDNTILASLGELCEEW